MLKYHPAMVYQRQSDYQVPLDALSAASKPLSDEEFYELKYKTAQNFGTLLEKYHDLKPEEKTYNLKEVSKETQLKAVKETAKYLLEQEGVAVDLKSPAYLQKLENLTIDIMKSKTKDEEIKKNISTLYKIAEQSAVYELVESLGGVHEIGTENAKDEYESVLKELSRK
jgi:sulfur transfer complex TusBCD TusB component (DsrH family)